MWGAGRGAGRAPREDMIEISLEPVAGAARAGQSSRAASKPSSDKTDPEHAPDTSAPVKIEIEIDPHMLHLDDFGYHQPDKKDVKSAQKASFPVTVDSTAEVNTSKVGFTCNSCGEKYTTYRQYTRHLRNHSSEPFTCLQCHKSFTCLTKLNIHARVHTNEKPFTCLVCGRKMASKYGLEQHMRIHTGERPYDCSHCGKRFTQTSSLLRHMELHTREKKFTCNRCGMKLSKFSQLKTHLQSSLCGEVS